MKKEIGFIGLGKMGSNMVLKLTDEKFKVVVYNRDKNKVRRISKHKNIIASFSLEEMVKKLPSPKIVFLMITAGKPIDSVINSLIPFLKKGDIIIDGGNSYYEDSVRRHNMLKKKGMNFLDVGVSGGIEKARHGCSLMVGGNKDIFRKTEFLFKALAEKEGCGYFGETGAGHFVKMVHNSIEYSLLESYAEGFGIIEKSKYNVDYKKLSGVWNHGSIIKSRLIELAERVFSKDSKLKSFKGKIGGGETGSWGLKVAKKEKVEVKALEHAIKKRKESMKKQSFSTKFISALRKEFGGHEEP